MFNYQLAILKNLLPFLILLPLYFTLGIPLIEYFECAFICIPLGFTSRDVEHDQYKSENSENPPDPMHTYKIMTKHNILGVKVVILY